MDSFVEAATARPERSSLIPDPEPRRRVRGTRRGTNNFMQAARATDPMRAWVIKGHLRWMRKVCERNGIRYEEVEWWTV